MSGPHIAVIGLGATGSAALYRLARRGIRVTGFDRFGVGNDRGSSHGPTRIIRLAHYENPAYVPLLRRAYALWHELEKAAGQRLVCKTGIAEIGPPAGELIGGTMAAISRHDLPHEVLDARTLMQRHPAFKIPDTFVAVMQPDGGYIEAAFAIEAQVRLAQAAGAVVRDREQVVAIEPRRNGVRLTTASGTLDADGAIVAAGPWLGGLLGERDLPLRVTRQVVGWFAPADPDQFAPGRFPVFILESAHGHHYGLPLYRGMGLKAAKHHHLDQAVAPDCFDRAVGAADEAAIRCALADHLPAANGRLVAAHTCLYTTTPDGTFIIDAPPGHPHIVIASPCCGHGFKFSPVVGEIVADLVTSGTTAHDIAQFRLGRFD